MDQPFTYRPSYFVNPEGSTALQNLLNEAKADFFNKAFGAQGQNQAQNHQAFNAAVHSERRAPAAQTKEALRT